VSGGPLALRAEGLGKEYELGERRLGGGSFYEALAGWLPGARRQAASRRERGRFWALRDVGFEVARGEVVGIVGRNGAGKSTLLKILSRITAPSEGRAVLHGRLASLLEVGTGFHPELTGRENIYLNGTILGMRKREIDAKFDDIAAFAEIDSFLDTPVKRYSSGMYVRLAFAVAAHLESDILVVDEVLAVGDLAFQRKSLGMMGDAARSGRTVLFVSHNLGAVRELCHSAVLLDRGRLQFRGAVADALAIYEAAVNKTGADLSSVSFAGELADRIVFEALELKQNGDVRPVVDPTQEVEVEIRGRALADFNALDLGIVVFRDGQRVFTCHDGPTGAPMRRGAFVSTIVLPGDTLRPGRYTVGLGAGQPRTGDWCWNPDTTALEVAEAWSPGVEQRNPGFVNVRASSSRRQ
jgi:homopolymeric O-antigen transport system ATP-binding protein